MIQAIGLTSDPRKELPPAVDDVSFEAHAGRVTALLGASGAGKTTVLRLMLELQRGRGITYFRGRPLHRIAHPSREVGVLLGDLPGHPARTVRGYLRMLCAAAGVPARRADEVLEVVGLVSLREERLGTLSRGMDRRLGLACALLADPHTLVLDGPAAGLSGRESRWLHGMLRAHAAQGGTVLLTTADPKEAARTADRVVTLKRGRLVADQDAADFARTRLRPRVAVRTPTPPASPPCSPRRRAPHTVPSRSYARAAIVCPCTAVRAPMSARPRFATASSSTNSPTRSGTWAPAPGWAPADRTANRRGAAHVGRRIGRCRWPWAQDHGAAGAGRRVGPSHRAGGVGISLERIRGGSAGTGRRSATGRRSHRRGVRAGRRIVASAGFRCRRSPRSPAPISVRPAPSPLRPLRYELRRALGVGTSFVTGAAVLVVSALTAVLLARVGHTPQARLMAGWPQQFPLPPAALGAGLLGAIAFGDEFRHPALAADRGTVPRRLGLLAAKLLVATVTALVLAVLTVGCDTEVLYLVYGPELAEVPADWLSLSVSWIGLMIGCAWAGVLAAGLFRSTTAGLAAVVAVPIVVVPLVQKVLEGPSVRTAAGFPLRLRELVLSQWPFGGERYLEAVARVVAQPVGGALTLSLTALLCAYLLTTLRGRVR